MEISDNIYEAASNIMRAVVLLISLGLLIKIGKYENKDEALKTIKLLKEKGLLPLWGGVPKMD